MPAWICGSAGASVPEFNCTVSASTALTASPPPWNTTVAIFCRPSRSFSTSAWSCGVVPIGGVETLNLSGFAFTSATNSFMFLAGRSDFTANTCGVTTGSQIATKSLNGSYGIEL